LITIVLQPDLYYANELNILIDVDPATASSTGKQIDFDQVLQIVQQCDSVCRAKYDTTFDGKKRNLYPLFSLVANRAPVEVIRTVYFANPFRFLDVRDDAGWTLMHYACAYNPLPLESLEFLEKRNSHTLLAWDHHHRSPLHTACAQLTGETEHVLFILNHTPPEVVVTPDRDGQLPLDLALRSGKCSSVLQKSLKEKAKGASPVSHDNNHNQPTTSPNHHNPTREDPSPPLQYKTTTETVGPQTWWEKLCCVPRI
jgi:ankyrin repeat protein